MSRCSQHSLWKKELVVPSQAMDLCIVDEEVIVLVDNFEQQVEGRGLILGTEQHPPQSSAHLDIGLMNHSFRAILGKTLP